MDDKTAGITGLSARQREILRLVLQGLQAKEIARQLGISERTVKTHTDAARRKLGAATTREAARLLADHDNQNGIVLDGRRPSGTIDTPEAEAPSSLRVADVVNGRANPGPQGLEARLAAVSPLGWLGLILATAIASALIAAGLMGGVLGLLDVIRRLSRVLPV